MQRTKLHKIHNTPAMRILWTQCEKINLNKSVAYSWVAYARAIMHPNAIPMSPPPDVERLWHQILLETDIHAEVYKELFNGVVPRHSTAMAMKSEEYRLRRMADGMTFIRALTGHEPPFIHHWHVPGRELKCIKVTHAGTRCKRMRTSVGTPAPDECDHVKHVYFYEGVSRKRDVVDVMSRVFGITSSLEFDPPIMDDVEILTI